ncbi:hypothetical protein IAT40_004763 [Kwoniella sp. CBS 6097]
MKSRSFADLAEAIGLNFGSSSKALSSSSASSLRPGNEYLLPRAHSAVDLQRKSYSADTAADTSVSSCAGLWRGR